VPQTVGRPSTVDQCLTSLGDERLSFTSSTGVDRHAPPLGRAVRFSLALVLTGAGFRKGDHGVS
jgi:hypothetical protein